MDAVRLLVGTTITAVVLLVVVHVMIPAESPPVDMPDEAETLPFACPFTAVACYEQDRLAQPQVRLVVMFDGEYSLMVQPGYHVSGWFDERAFGQLATMILNAKFTLWDHVETDRWTGTDHLVGMFGAVRVLRPCDTADAYTEAALDILRDQVSTLRANAHI